MVWYFVLYRHTRPNSTLKPSRPRHTTNPVAKNFWRGGGDFFIILYTGLSPEFPKISFRGVGRRIPGQGVHQKFWLTTYDAVVIDTSQHIFPTKHRFFAFFIRFCCYCTNKIINIFAVNPTNSKSKLLVIFVFKRLIAWIISIINITMEIIVNITMERENSYEV